MGALRYPAPAGSAEGLVVLLPGLGDDPGSFAANGFVETIQSLDPKLEVVAVDAHLGYYRSATIVPRLHEDVVVPALSRGDRVWIVGISMGGLGAAAYASEHPETVAGLVLLAPYMGSDEVVEEIRRAGGLASWQPQDAGADVDASRRRYVDLWRWYRGYATEPDHRPKLFLGHGDADRLAPANELVAAVLPPDRRLTGSGGHAWVVWKPLFEELAARAFAPATRDHAEPSSRRQ
ncbi:MAG: alpha/beta fold hydrolase [Planctomycetota bacterium]